MEKIPGLSVIIIVRDEEKDIRACLESVAEIANEIVVVDSGSTDRTMEICGAFTEKIFQKDWNGFAAQKQFALDQAQGPWVLNIDADERLSPKLRLEIARVLKQNPAHNGYMIPYRHYFLGKRLRFSGVQGERHIRLFKKSESSYGHDRVHEGVHVRPPIGELSSPMEHVSYRDIDEYLRKCNFYTSLIAERKWEEGERFHFWHHLRLPAEFLSRYVLKLGFLDGQAGLVYSTLSSYYVWLKYLKLRDLEMQNQKGGGQ